MGALALAEDQIAFDYHCNFKWAQGPLEEPQPSNVGECHLKLADSRSVKPESSLLAVFPSTKPSTLKI